MRINPKARFAGVSLGRVRDALGRLHAHDWTMDELREALGVDGDRFERVVQKLQDDGLIELAHQWPHGKSVWRNSLRGGGLVHSSVTNRVPRELAQRHVRALLERARTVNASNRYLYRIRRIRLFGSLLRSDRDFVSDADLAIDLEPKEPDDGRHRALTERRAAEAADAGQLFADAQERRWWAQEEVWRFLKGGSKLLHLVPAEDKVLDQTATRVVYEQR